MKSTATHNLQYSGIVTLSQSIGAKKFNIVQIHNKGGNPLFNFLADCLVGDFDMAKVERPTRIMLLRKEDDGHLSAASDAGFIELLTKPEKIYHESAGIIKYSFAISQDILTYSKFNAIGLYNKSTALSELDNYAALCEITDTDRSNISTSAMLVVDWQLIISNKA